MEERSVGVGRTGLKDKTRKRWNFIDPLENNVHLQSEDNRMQEGGTYHEISCENMYLTIK